MKNSFLLLAGAAALSLASCSQEKTADTTTTTTTDGATTAMSMPDTAAYRTRSQRIADKFATDMKISDEGTKNKIRTAYYNRSKRYGEMTSKYKTDTTGRAGAMRQYNTDTDTEFQGVLTDPAQYQSYQSSRSTYDESNYMGDNTSATTPPADNSGAMSSSTDNSTTSSGTTGSADMSDNTATGSAGTVKSSKTKLQDGSKIKIKDDGTVKTKDADGSKSKM